MLRLHLDRNETKPAELTPAKTKAIQSSRINFLITNPFIAFQCVVVLARRHFPASLGVETFFLRNRVLSKNWRLVQGLRWFLASH
jgi:hypothetical protein